MKNIEKIISDLELAAHPEGGYYKRVYASDIEECFWPDKQTRAIQTAIIYLLNGKSFSAFHRIRSDELWFLGEANTGIRILEIHPEGIVVHLLSRSQPVHCVKANIWFAAELVDTDEQHFALAYCTVAPGFDFADFELANEKQLLQELPQCEADTRSVIQRMCREKSDG